MPESAAARTRTAPHTWLLMGEKAGDNAQVRVIGESLEALGWPVEERRVALLEPYRVGKPRVRASLYHVDLERSDPLSPPWPDLLITIGRRLSMAALWVKERSGNRSRIVLVGRPRRLRARFDLIVSSSQYRMRPGPHVLTLGLPLMRVDPAAVLAAGEGWRTRLDALPRPLTALLVGGPTKPVVFDANVARELGARAGALLERDGGSLYVTTSRRTPPAVADALAASLPRETRFFRWHQEAKDNPYAGLLAHADRFVVTSDSVTMMVEVARLGRPLAVFELPRARWQRLRQLLGASRDLSSVPHLLREHGLAVSLGEDFRAPAGPVPDELPRVVERIRALVAGTERSA